MVKPILKKALMDATEPKKIVNFKVTDSEMDEIKKNASRFYNGNVSGWIRYTALNYAPKKSELVLISSTK